MTILPLLAMIVAHTVEGRLIQSSATSGESRICNYVESYRLIRDSLERLHATKEEVVVSTSSSCCCCYCRQVNVKVSNSKRPKSNSTVKRIKRHDTTIYWMTSNILKTTMDLTDKDIEYVIGVHRQSDVPIRTSSSSVIYQRQNKVGVSSDSTTGSFITM
jgi:hypothetical protein